MSNAPVKPWSGSDDDTDAGDDHFPNNAAIQPPSRFLGLELSAPAWLSPFHAGIPLVIASGWIIFALTGIGRTASTLRPAECMGILLLLLAGGVMLALTWQAHRVQHAHLLDEVRTLRPSQQNALTSATHGNVDIRAILSEIEQHAGNVEDRTRELLEQHKQLTLRHTLADTQRRQVESILESINEPLIVTDSFDRLLFANTAAETLLASPLREKLRMPIAEAITNEKVLHLISDARKADSRSARRRAEIELGDRNYAVCISPLVPLAAVNQNSDHGVIALFRDNTQETHAAQNKSQFVAQVAHELRTPLTSIAAYVEMLVDGEAADEKTRGEYYEIIQTSTQRLSRLIDNVLNISRIEARTVRVNKTPVALALLVKEATDTLRPQADAKQIVLTEELTPLAYQILADRDLILQAILNLISNAIKYTPRSGTIQVRMTPHEEHRTIHVEVIDTGAGIPVADLPHVFEKFFRVEANKSLAPGTGLGLNLVKQIVETIHDGQVILNSEVGKGSTFGIVLPLAG